MDELSPEQIAADIVNRFAWTTNVMSKGVMVSQQVVVAATIANAIEKERAQFKIFLDSYATENQQFSDEIDSLRAALQCARRQLVTLGGEARLASDDDQIQAQVLYVIDFALTNGALKSQQNALNQ